MGEGRAESTDSALKTSALFCILVSTSDVLRTRMEVHTQRKQDGPRRRNGKLQASRRMPSAPLGVDISRPAVNRATRIDGYGSVLVMKVRADSPTLQGSRQRQPPTGQTHKTGSEEQDEKNISCSSTSLPDKKGSKWLESGPRQWGACCKGLASAQFPRPVANQAKPG